MTSDIKFFEEYGEQLHKKIEELLCGLFFS